MDASANHWQSVYGTRDEQHTSWFRPRLDESLRLIDGLPVDRAAPVIDIGGGRSTLVDDLLARGFSDVTVLDLSEAALAASKQRLGTGAAMVRWQVADVLQAALSEGVALWHDRAVFHFLTADEAQRQYVDRARRSVRDGGYLLVATFAEDGPEHCSGLPVCRYDASSLASRFADGFVPVASSREIHHTPFATDQAFTYLVLRRDHDIASDPDFPHSRAAHAPDPHHAED